MHLAAMHGRDKLIQCLISTVRNYNLIRDINAVVVFSPEMHVPFYLNLFCTTFD